MTTVPAFLQELDVVRVSPDRFPPAQIYQNVLRASRVTKLALVIYGHLTLHPWQAFDHPLFRSDGNLGELLSGPESPVIFLWPAQTSTFQGCLDEFFRRSGENAFVFSSVNKGTLVAQTWGDKVDPGWTREELFKQASRHHDDYAQMVELARHCDERKVRIESSGRFSYDTALRECSESGVNFERPDEWSSGWWPGSRSAVQQALRLHAHAKGELWRLNDYMAPYDRVYNMVLADTHRAIPVACFEFNQTEAAAHFSQPGSEREEEKIVLVEHWLTQSIVARKRHHVIQINYDILTHSFPEFAKCLDQFNVRGIIEASAAVEVSQKLNEARRCMEQGATNPATSYFNQALEELWHRLDKGRVDDSTATSEGSIEINLWLVKAKIPTSWFETIVKRAAILYQHQIHGVVTVHTEPPEC